MNDLMPMEMSDINDGLQGGKLFKYFTRELYIMNTNNKTKLENIILDVKGLQKNTKEKVFVNSNSAINAYKDKYGILILTEYSGITSMIFNSVIISHKMNAVSAFFYEMTSSQIEKVRSEYEPQKVRYEKLNKLLKV